MLALTHLEVMVMDRWIDDQWSIPDKTEWYLMQVAAEIRLTRYSFASNTPSVKLTDFKIPFLTGEEARAEQEKRVKKKLGEYVEISEEEAKREEQQWKRALGMTGPGSKEAREKRDPDPNFDDKRMKEAKDRGDKKRQEALERRAKNKHPRAEQGDNRSDKPLVEKSDTTPIGKPPVPSEYQGKHGKMVIVKPSNENIEDNDNG